MTMTSWTQNTKLFNNIYTISTISTISTIYKVFLLLDNCVLSIILCAALLCICSLVQIIPRQMYVDANLIWSICLLTPRAKNKWKVPSTNVKALAQPVYISPYFCQKNISLSQIRSYWLHGLIPILPFLLWTTKWWIIF